MRFCSPVFKQGEQTSVSWGVFVTGPTLVAIFSTPYGDELWGGRVIDPNLAEEQAEVQIHIGAIPHN